MESFVTYWPRYALHPQTKAFEILGEHRSRVLDIDCSAIAGAWVDALMQLSFESIEGGKYLCKENCSKQERVINSEDEVESFAVELAKGWDIEHTRDYLEEYLEKEEAEEYFDEILQAIESIAIGHAADEWNTFVYSNS